MPSLKQLLQHGWQLHQSGDIDAARRCYEQALAAEPNHTDALVYLGIALFDQRQFQESVASYRKAIARRPLFPVAWNNLGNSLRMLAQIDEAEECFAEALRQKPGYLSAIKNRGTLWLWNGDIERGLSWFEQGLQIDPDHAELHRNLGVIYLLLGNYEKGWAEYRWRWRMPGMQRPRLRAPVWNGESLRDATILIYPEQGLGDTLQFIRVATELKQLGARVLLQCSARMLPLFTSAPDVDQLVLETAPPPNVDYHASMIEAVDLIFGIRGEMPWGTRLFQDRTGYLTVSDPLIAYWKGWLDSHIDRPRVGINWQGNPKHDADVYRSIPLQTLSPLASIPGIHLINLQFGFGREQLDQCDFADKILQLPDHVDTDGGAFTDSAAILKNLDCVVTTDTAIAHLAGAMGTPVILMLGHVPDWRWRLENDHTPWYPAMTLVRKTQYGSWDDVVERVCCFLQSPQNGLSLRS